MALGSSPPPEIRSPDERGGAAEDAAEAELVEEEVFDDAFDIPHKNAPHDRLRRWRVRTSLVSDRVPFEFGSSATPG
jgi:Ca2+-transporting ATPase